MVFIGQFGLSCTHKKKKKNYRSTHSLTTVKNALRGYAYIIEYH